MARVATEGFEGGASPKTAGLGFFSSGDAALTTTHIRSGDCAARCAVTLNVYTLPSALSEFYLRFGMKMETNGTSAYFFQGRNGTTQIVALKMVLTGGTYTIGAYVGTTLVATGVIPINEDMYYLAELYVKVADIGGRISLKIDGIQDTGVDYTGDTKPGADTTIDNIGWVRPGGSNYIDLDDIALNDTTGAVDNSWCGDGHIICLRPTSDDSVQWTPSTGASNYALVDEVTLDTTDYVYDDGTSGHKDIYGLENPGLVDNAVISRVWHQMVAWDAGGTADQIKGKINAGGTEYDEDTFTLSSNPATYKSAERTINPFTSAAWTESDLDGLKAGVEVV